MSAEILFTKENLDEYLKELGKEFRKLNGTKMPAELVLIGGAAVLANYGFRDTTNDVDAIIRASSVMKEAVNHVGDKLGLPTGWLNMDFKRTASFSDKLEQVSVYYRTFSNILTIRTVSAEYLIAMKLISGREYKKDLSDIAGILWEHQQKGDPISMERIDKAVALLYGSVEIPKASREVLDDVFGSGDYERLYNETRKNEIKFRDSMLKKINEPTTVVKEESMKYIIEKAKQKKRNQSDEN